MQLIKKIACAVVIFTGAYSNVQAADSKPWKITVAPYLWAINMDGDVQIAPQSAHVSESFSDILKEFHGGGMLWLDATNDKFGLFANAMYARLEQTTDIDIYSINSVSKFGLFTFGASYRAFERKYSKYNQFSIEPYIGARYTLNDATVTVQDPSVSASKNVNWTDPIIGARLLCNINRQWSIKFAGDIGGTNFNNDKSYNLNALVGYNPSATSDLFTLYLGYRILYQHYQKGSGQDLFIWKMHLFGPVLGFAFKF